MGLDIVLFGLRMGSSLLLLSMFVGIFIVLWRDYRTAALLVDNSRRVYGQLLGMAQIDDLYAPNGETYPLLPITSLGRSPTNSIVIDDNFASSEHANIILRNGQWWLEDRNSRNGTLLNGEPITSPVIITDGDIIGIGNNSYKLAMD